MMPSVCWTSVEVQHSDLGLLLVLKSTFNNITGPKKEVS